MSDIDGGGPAFPVITTNETMTSGPWASSPGMTVRDYFAAKAMGGRVTHNVFESFNDEDAKQCYAIADAMLAARKEATNA